MLTEADLRQFVGLVARFYKNGVSYDEKFSIQRWLLIRGVQLDHPVDAPDPNAPPGGSAIAMRKAV